MYTVSSMSILCLWDIQLTFDWVGIEPHGTYHHISKLKQCKGVQEFDMLFARYGHSFVYVLYTL